MKKILTATICSIFLWSCTNTSSIPKRRITYPNNTVTTLPKANNNVKVDEYEQLLKTYKSETAEVLTDLLNTPSPTDTKTSLLIENKSRCNMVMIVSGNNYYNKIPIAAGKMAGVMVPKKQNYKLSTKICGTNYQTTKYISESISLKLGN